MECLLSVKSTGKKAQIGMKKPIELRLFFNILHVGKKKNQIALASFIKVWKMRGIQLFSMMSQWPDELHLAVWLPTMSPVQLAMDMAPESPAPNIVSKQENPK